MSCRYSIIYQSNYGPMPAVLTDPYVSGGEIGCYDPFENEEVGIRAANVLHVADPRAGRVMPYLECASYADIYAALTEAVGEGELRVAANATKTPYRLPTRTPKRVLTPIVSDMMSGWFRAEKFVRRHRAAQVQPQAIVACGLFCIATVHTAVPISEARLWALKDYVLSGEWPDDETVVSVIPKGLHRSFAREAGRFMRADWPQRMAAFINKRGWVWEDRHLRRLLCTQVGTPNGLGLAKFSFLLMLLGHNLMCLDVHMLVWLYSGGKLLSEMAPAEKRDLDRRVTAASNRFSSTRKGRLVAPRNVKFYEGLEDLALAHTEYYDPRDPLGVVRAHWMTWERLQGGGPAPHEALMAILDFIYDGIPPQLPEGYKPGRGKAGRGKGLAAFERTLFEG